MAEAPEKIWAFGASHGSGNSAGTWRSGKSDVAVEYVRADLLSGYGKLDAENAVLERQIAELRENNERLQHKADQYDSVVKALSVCDGGRYRNDTVESCVLALKARDAAEAENARLRALPLKDEVGRVVEPEGEPVSLAACAIGLFESGNGELCLKTEYGSNEGRIDAYIVSSGELFWGGTVRPADQRKVIVQPVAISAAPSEQRGDRG